MQRRSLGFDRWIRKIPWRRALCWVVVFILKHWTSVVALQVLTKELCAVWSEPPESPYTRWGTWLTRPVRALSPECRAVCFPGAGALDRLRGAAARAVPREEGPATGSWARPAGTRKGKSHGVCEPKSANSEGPSLFHRGDIQTPSASQQEMLWQRDRASGVKARVKSEAPEGRAGFEMSHGRGANSVPRATSPNRGALGSYHGYDGRGGIGPEVTAKSVFPQSTGPRGGGGPL